VNSGLTCGQLPPRNAKCLESSSWEIAVRNTGANPVTFTQLDVYDRSSTVPSVNTLRINPIAVGVSNAIGPRTFNGLTCRRSTVVPCAQLPPPNTITTSVSTASGPCTDPERRSSWPVGRNYPTMAVPRPTVPTRPCPLSCPSPIPATGDGIQYGVPRLAPVVTRSARAPVAGHSPPCRLPAPGKYRRRSRQITLDWQDHRRRRRK
jgi:hypothetical protein